MTYGRMNLLCVALLFGAALSSADTVTIGSTAPAMSVAAWVKDTPVPKFDKGKVYVVEFWATWCGPCKRSIPLLTDLSKKYAGRVVCAGVSTMEDQKNDTDTSYFAQVKHFVKREGDKMAYHVAIDGPKHTMATTWLDAAGEGGLPTAFIVDRKGKIAWIGNPLLGLDEALSQIVSGKYDLAAAAAARKKEKSAQAANIGQAVAPSPKSRINDLANAIENKDWKSAVETCDRLFDEDPHQEFQLGPMRFLALLQTNESAAYGYAKKLGEGLFKDEPMQLSTMSEMILSPEYGPKDPNTGLALQLAKQAVNAPKGQVAQFYDALANAQFRAGDAAAAVSSESKAFELLKSSKDPQEIRDRLQSQMTKHLEQFKAKRASEGLDR